MNEILFKNINIIANSTMWFCEQYGIHDDDFVSAIRNVTVATIIKHYQDKGEEFSFDTVEVSEEAMLAVYEHITALAQAAALAIALGMVVPKASE